MPEDNLIYRRLENYDDILVKQAVVIHYASLSYKSFITSFGIGFLEKIYRMILTSSTGFLLLALDKDNDVKGFILYTLDTGTMFRLFFQNLHVFWISIVGSILKKPTVIFKLFQTLFYPAKEGVDIKAELLSIAVKDEYRSKSIGAKLVEHLDNEMVSLGIREYKVAVLQNMERSNHFYGRLGFQLTNSFNMYNQRWNLYVRKLHHEKY